MRERLHKGLIMKRSTRRMGSLVFAVAALIAMGAQAAPGSIRPSDHLHAAKIKATPPPTPFDDECCSDPGQITECWWQDAVQDNVTCKVAADCPSGQDCNLDPENTNTITNEGLCECTTQAHCEAGIGDDQMAGQCVADKGVCGPSYCNGIKICSCFGGCKNATWTSSDGSTTYDTPQELCENTTGAGFCCEGEIYAATPGTSVQGYCWSSDTCGPPGPAGDAGVPPECVARWDSCAYSDSNECTAGMCVGPDGGPFDCQPVPLSSAAQAVLTQCCDPAPGFESTFDDGDPCTDDSCCANAAFCNLYHEDHQYRADDSALEYWERFDCEGQNPFADICQKWFCEDDGGGGLSCQEAAAEGDDCTEWAGASCGSEWTCVADVCTETTVGSSPVGVEEDCASTERVDLDADDQTDGDSTCAEDDYDAIYTAGSRFATCNSSYLARADNADVVYHYDVTTDTSFGLEHVRVELRRGSPSERWQTYMHAREDEDSCTDESAQVACVTTDCDDGFSGTNYPYASMSFDCTSYNNGNGGFDTVMTLGPWPIRDTTDSSASDGIVSAYDWTGSIIVDHLIDGDLSDAFEQIGGEFELETEKEAHINDSCVNTGAYLSTPMINNFNSWKERWQGTFDDHDTSTDTSCSSDADPQTAFYRIELEAGYDGTAGAADYWPHMYKLYTDTAATYGGSGVVDTVLTRWNGVQGQDGACSLGTAYCCNNVPASGNPLSEPQEFYFETGEAGWLAVSNWDAADVDGNYELTSLRSPRPFFGFQEPFGWDAAGCDKEVTTDWNLGGTRLDFVPTNDAKDGFMVLTDTSADWLFDPDDLGSPMPANNELCKGVECNSATSSLVQAFPFTFPYSGDLYTHYCVNPAGQIIFGKSSSMSCGYNTVANSSESVNPWVAPLWGSIIPCWCSSRQNGMWSDNDAWGGECESYNYPDIPLTHDGDGVVSVQPVDFEGTRAVAVSWDGFDGHRDLVTRESGQTTRSFTINHPAQPADECTYWYGQWEDVYVDDCGGTNIWVWVVRCVECAENDTADFNPPGNGAWNPGAGQLDDPVHASHQGPGRAGTCDSARGDAFAESSDENGTVQDDGPLPSSAPGDWQQDEPNPGDPSTNDGYWSVMAHCCDDPAASAWTETVSREACYRDDSDDALQFQAILREDGRFTFYYKTANSIMTDTMWDENSWIVGLSGTRYSERCTNNSQCNSGNPSGGAWYWPDGDWTSVDEYYCDNSNHGVTDFRPGFRCAKDIGQNTSTEASDWHLHDGLDGTWQP